MTRTLAAFVLILLSATAVAAQRPDPPAPQALRERLEGRYNVVPIDGGVALTPKGRRGEVRLIEVTDTIAVNGTTVTGGELRERLGADADAVLQLSYMDAAARRSLFEAPQAGTAKVPPEARPVEPPGIDERRRHRARGDRVRIFGDVTVGEHEEIAGQVVAVFGSVRIDGTVGDQVVAVFGSIDLGPKAIVQGDLVSVGGRVRRAETAQVRGGVTEVAVGQVDVPRHVAPWLAGIGLFSLADGFGALPRLVGSTFRLFLLVILGVLAYLVARRTVERSAEEVRENPLKSTAVGVVAALLAAPLLFVTSIVLVLTIIGIPLLLLVPFVVAFLFLLALAGFSGTAYAIGEWAGRRFGFPAGGGASSVAAGVVLILLPLLLARIVALGGWATAPFAFLLGAVAFGLEFLVWSAGFGAALSNAVAGWRGRRALQNP